MSDTRDTAEKRAKLTRVEHYQAGGAVLSHWSDDTCYACPQTGTAWTAPGEGATLSEFDKAIQAQDGTANALSVERSEDAMSALIQKLDVHFQRTNLRLTGSPLTAADLENIAECEVSR